MIILVVILNRYSRKMNFMLQNKTFILNRLLKKLADLKLAIILLFIIGVSVAIGTFIEQEQSLNFYKENYPLENPFFGFIDLFSIVPFFFQSALGFDGRFIRVFSLFRISRILKLGRFNK